ncbi:MAG: hypothetical protein M1617_03715 [Actinobacteria bacterium]|nr:hypothetical protein [Actinomycetota bacterium]MCL5887397.1 hypothetical protein [Actinomycetota bacterium]
MRRIRLLVFVSALAVLVFALTPGVAMANFGPHGGYSMDTDSCAGCHRAHTAASGITWTRADNTQGSALLMSTASEVYQFCYTCHDSVGLGADTNVEEGIYEGTLAGNITGGRLNAGGFDSGMFPTSHMYTGASWFAYGGATDSDLLGNLSDGDPQIVMSCTSCHDVHGSSNYRLLKDRVNGRTVGGYDPTAPGATPENPMPTPWVVSAEPGYPAMGWLLHEPGAAQMAAYQPNYTTPLHAKPPGLDTARGISGWCSACHIQYMQPTGAVFDTSLTPGEGGNETLVVDTARGYDSGDGFGAAVRHRHPINVDLAGYLGPRPINVNAPGLALSHDPENAGTNDSSDWMSCLTCHVAHGSSSEMTGYANVADSRDPQPNSGTGGVPPSGGNSLLRLDNRGVCQSCHNK